MGTLNIPNGMNKTYNVLGFDVVSNCNACAEREIKEMFNMPPFYNWAKNDKEIQS